MVRASLAILLALFGIADTYAADWCPIDGRNDATRDLPSGARLSLSETGELRLRFDEPADCISGDFPGDFKFGSEDYFLVFIPPGGGKHHQVGI